MLIWEISRPLSYCFFSDDFLKPTVLKTALGRTAFVPPELARVDMDLITAGDPHDHLGNNTGAILPHQLVLPKGQERKGALMTQISGFRFLPMEYSGIHRHGYEHDAYCWVLFFQA